MRSVLKEGEESRSAKGGEKRMSGVVAKREGNGDVTALGGGKVRCGGCEFSLEATRRY
jgi:hypothetical protein